MEQERVVLTKRENFQPERVVLSKGGKLVLGSWLKVTSGVLIRCLKCRVLQLRSDVVEGKISPFQCESCSWNIVIELEGWES